MPDLLKNSDGSPMDSVTPHIDFSQTVENSPSPGRVSSTGNVLLPPIPTFASPRHGVVDLSALSFAGSMASAEFQHAKRVFYDMIEADNVDAVNTLVVRFPDIVNRIFHPITKDTPFLYAIRFNSLKLLEYFQDYTAIDYNLLSPANNTALGVALQESNLQLVDQLCERHHIPFNIYVPNKEGRDMLFDAIATDRMDVALYIINQLESKRFPVFLNGIDSDGYTMLYYSGILHCNVQVTSLLLRNGADINQPTGKDLYPLIGELLRLKRFKDVEAYCAEFRPLIDTSIPFHDGTLLHDLVGTGEAFKYRFNVPDLHETPLLSAARQNSTPAVFTILAQIRDHSMINVATRVGVTALMYACENGNVNIATALLGHRADITLADEQGNTALTYASLGGKASCIKLLLSLQCKIDAPQHDTHRTPLWHAVTKNYYDSTLLLLQAKANPNVMASPSPLHVVSTPTASATSTSATLSTSLAQNHPMLSAFGQGLSIDLLAKANDDESHSQDEPVLSQFQPVRTPTSILAPAAGGLRESTSLLSHDVDDYTSPSVEKSTTKTSSTPASIAASLHSLTNHSQHSVPPLTVTHHQQQQQHQLQQSHLSSSSSYSTTPTPTPRSISRSYTTMNTSIFSTDFADDDQLTLLAAVAREPHLMEKYGPLLIQYGADPVPALHFAAEKGYKESISIILQHTPNIINRTNSDSASSLIIAARYGHLDLVQLLVEKGADVNHHDNQHRTALYFASSYSHLPIVEYLLEKGANPSSASSANRTPLYNAIKNKHEAMVRLLLDKNANVNIRDSTGVSPINLAVQYSLSSVAELLLDHSADVNSLADRSPLMSATQTGNEKLVDLLIERKARVDLQNDKRQTALYFGMLFQHESIVNKLLDKGADPLYALMAAAKSGNIGILQQLLGLNIDINRHDSDFRTALLHASREGHANFVKILLERNAKVDHVDQVRTTSLSLAVKYNRANVVEILLYAHRHMNGIHPTLLSAAGSSASGSGTQQRNSVSHHSRSYSSTTISTLSPSHSSSVIVGPNGKELKKDEPYPYCGLDIPDQSKWTPLFHSLIGKSYDITRLLLQAKADVNFLDQDHWSPLLTALAYDAPSAVVSELLEAKAQVNISDRIGLTPLMVAASRGNSESVRVLISHKADVHATDRNGATAMHKAKSNPKISTSIIIKLLKQAGAKD